MAALRNSLYRNLLRTFRQFTLHGLPCHGLVVQAASNEQLAAALQSYQQLHPSIDLEEQGAEPATRAAILRWQQLLLHHAPSSTQRSADADPSTTAASTADRNPVPRTQPSSSGSSRVATPLAWATVEQQILQYAAAAEEAAFTLFEISRSAASSDGEDSDDPLLSLSVEESDGEGQEGEQQVGLTSREGAVKALDALAQQAAEASRRMEQEQQRSSAPQQTATSTSAAAAAMQGVASVLLQSRSRLRCDAIEWVYDGLGPLLLPDVLRRRKGAPLSLAIACSSVARRLGVAALPVCAAPGPGSSSQDSQLPPEMAAKQAGRAVLAAPSPDLWVVLCCMPSVKAAGSVAGEGQVRWPDLSVKCLTGAGAGDSFSAGVEGLVVDVTRRGATLPWTEFRQQTPAVTVMVDAWWQAGQVPIRLRSLCAALVRSAMTAHQRRGESDLVVHYLYQLLALDPAAPEWQRALQPADV